MLKYIALLSMTTIISANCFAASAPVVPCPSATTIQSVANGAPINLGNGIFIFGLGNNYVTVLPEINSILGAKSFLKETSASYTPNAIPCPSPTCQPAAYICFYKPGANGIAPGDTIMWSSAMTMVSTQK